MNKYSYILIGDDRGRNHLDSSPENSTLQLSGLYQWANAFKRCGKGGTIEPFWRKEDLEDYDIVHINMTPSNLQHISVIRNELGESSSTKIICNIDLDVTHWSVNFSYYMTALVKELEKADVLFHVESTGANVLSHIVDRNVYVCPHPVDVSSIYDYIIKYREPMAGVIFHRYTGESMTPYIALRNIPLRRVLFGYTPIGKQAAVSNAGMYDDILPYQDFKSNISEMAKMFLGCDLYQGYSYGRAVVEFAALEVPIVASNTIGAARYLFPETAVNPFDTKDAEDKFKRIISDPDFADSVIRTAAERCSLYSLENRYKAFCGMIES
ncbi:MAG: hypothetical protein PHH85_02060 [Candidatus Methanoperedens sp.]|nr:hypothetical protein [Candidatus Methanoperedens sp.]